MKSDGKKLDQAKKILAALGMPEPQQNPNAIYTLVAFANVGPRVSWVNATAPRLTPHDVIAFAGARYRKKYAENTRETIRRQAIHQFVQGRIYISAFRSFREFKKYAHDIAWEAEVWIADAPGHLLHFNGDRFMGPRTR